MLGNPYKERDIKNINSSGLLSSMELEKYVNKKVKVDLSNGFYYEGVVISYDDNSICIKDKFGNDIDIKEEIITFIREVKG